MKYGALCILKALFILKELRYNNVFQDCSSGGKIVLGPGGSINLRDQLAIDTQSLRVRAYVRATVK